MAVLKNPMDSEVHDDIKTLFNEMTYSNFNGVKREVDFVGGEARVEHGLGFKPTVGRLTVRVHVALADIGQVYLTREPDDKYVYVSAPRNGKVHLEISHPPRDER